MHTVYLKGVPLGAWGPVSLAFISLMLLASVHVASFGFGPSKMHRGKQQDQAYKTLGSGPLDPQGDAS